MLLRLKRILPIVILLLDECAGLFFDQLFGRGGGSSYHQVTGDYYDVCRDTCRLAMSCWFSGGQVMRDQLCGSVFHICCAERRRMGLAAEARKITNWDSSNLVDLNTIEEDPFPEVHFGPVVNEPDCGVPKMSRRRVVGGANAGFGTFPWQALIRIRASRCGGALVGPRHVVTAGHCVHALGAELKSDFPPRGVHVFLGEYSLYNQVSDWH